MGLVVTGALLSAPSRSGLLHERRDLEQQRLRLSERRNRLLRERVFGGTAQVAGDDSGGGEGAAAPRPSPLRR